MDTYEQAVTEKECPLLNLCNQVGGSLITGDKYQDLFNSYGYSLSNGPDVYDCFFIFTQVEMETDFFLYWLKNSGRKPIADVIENKIARVQAGESIDVEEYVTELVNVIENGYGYDDPCIILAAAACSCLSHSEKMYSKSLYFISLAMEYGTAGIMENYEKHKYVPIVLLYVALCRTNYKGYIEIAMQHPGEEITSILMHDTSNVEDGTAQESGDSSKGDSAGGCYIATAIYGSYDCPEVWTLRRYRDSNLAKAWYGRAFIHTYYAISPIIVKYFGNTVLFKNICKPRLDHLVKKLQNDGYQSTPYKDRNW